MKTKKRLLSLLLCGTMLFSLCPQSVLAETSAQDSGSAMSAGGLCKHHSEHNEDCGYTEGTAGSPCTYDHTDDCYREVINCTHKHDQDCYLQDSVSEDDATPSNAEKREPENCPHICDEDSGCVTKELDCRHEHDDSCGYAPATKGTPCKYVCQICDPQYGGSASGQNVQKPGEEATQDGDEDECICTEPCREDNVNVDCPVCGIIEEEDLALCKGAKPETATPSNAVQLSVGDVQKLIDELPTADELAAMSLEEQQEVYEKLQAAYEAYNALTEEQKEEVIGAEIFDSLFAVFASMTNTLTEEQFPSLDPGETYWFDLSDQNIPGTVNNSVPDTRLTWVPFTYVGTINAYSCDKGVSLLYDHSLFIADYNLTYAVSWDDLNDVSMIFGEDYTSSGVDYTLRVLSAGSDNNSESGENQRGTPENNEWDTILNKGDYIKNWSDMYSWGQDTYMIYGTSFRVNRGRSSARRYNYGSPANRHPSFGFRPVLEIPDTLDSGELQVVAVDLGGGSIGTTTGTVNLVVESGKDFTAPSGDGLTAPDGTKFSGWKDSDGKTYAPGDAVSGDVATLTAQWVDITVCYNISANAGEGGGSVSGGGTIVSGNSATVTATPDIDHHFVKWTENGQKVSTEENYQFTVTGDRTLTAVFEEHSGETAPCGERAKCAVCGEEYGDPGKHNLTQISEKPAACTETGTIEHWHCLACNKNFFDADGQKEVSERDLIITALGHEWDTPDWKWNEDYTLATANFTCKRDSSHTKAETDSSPTSEITKEAACTTAGEKKYTAKATLDGQEYYGTATAEIPATGHRFGSWKSNYNGTHTGPCTHGCGEERMEECNNINGRCSKCNYEWIAISAQPQSQTVKERETATFRVAATGSRITSYQWQVSTDNGVNWTDIDSATNMSYTTTEAAMKMNGSQYRVVVSNSGEQAESTAATLTVRKSSSGSGGGSSNVSYPDKDEPQIPTTGQTTPVKPETSGNAGIDSSAVQDAINEATADAKKNGNTSNGIAVAVPIQNEVGAQSLTITIPANTLDKLVAANVRRFDITTNGLPSFSFTFDALKMLDTQSQGGDLILRITKTTASSDEAKAAISTRPVYDISLVYVQNGKETPLTDWMGKTVSVKLPYSLGKGEQHGNLYAVSVSSNGKVEWFTKSSYDADQKAVIFEAAHFGVYGVGYRNPVSAFTDIDGHWAKEHILFTVSRGLFSDISETAFSPNTTLTRGMFVTTLGRLAGINPSSYQTGTFTDVKADAYYAPYVNWAAKTGIVSGTTSTTFAPDSNITREQMAVIMKNYADKMGYSIPKTLEAVTFADYAKISYGAKDAVTAMQQAGVLSGKTGNQFDPLGNATRAEAAAVLHRFVEVIIDPQTANGWTQNDSGEWHYNQNGESVRGWLSNDQKWYWLDKTTGKMFSGGWTQIDGKWYYFYVDGSMAANTKVDGYEVDANGARK